MSEETRDSNGTLLADGDTVTLIKDLKVKGSGGVTLKRGTVVKKIRLTGDPDELPMSEGPIACRLRPAGFTSWEAT